jgi:hypothetical protein
MSTATATSLRAGYAVVLVVLAGAPALGAPPATGAAPTIAGGRADGTFDVTLDVAADLAGLSPAATRGTWTCSAHAQSATALAQTAERIRHAKGPQAREYFATLLEAAAHYLGQQATATFPVSGGRYAGTTRVTIRVQASELATDRVGHVVADPAVLVGCWLGLYDGDGRGGLVSGPGAGKAPTLQQVAITPYVLASGAVPGG